MMKSLSRAGRPDCVRIVPPLLEVFSQDARYGGAALGAVLGLAPLLELPVAEDFCHPCELSVEGGPAKSPELLVAARHAVLQAHDRRVAVREDRLAWGGAKEHLGADRLDGLRRERPAGQRTRTHDGGVAGAACARGPSAADHGFSGELASVGLDLRHRR